MTEIHRIPALAPGKQYIVNVRAINGSKASEWSAARVMTTVSDAIAPGPVTGLSADFSSVDLVLAWTAPSPMPTDFDKYVITVTSGGAAKTFTTKSTKFTLPLEQNISLWGSIKTTFDVSIVAVDRTGNASAAATATATNAVPANISAPLSSDFTSPDVVLSWPALSPLPVDFDRYKISMTANSITKTYYSTSPLFTLPYSQNVTDFSGARASFSVSVKAVDLLGQESAQALSGTATNASPSAPTTFAGNFDSQDAVVAWTAPSPLPSDFDKYKIVMTNGTTSKTYYSFAPAYTLPLSKNAVDFSGAKPTFSISITTVDIFGQESSALPGTVTNAAPAVPTSLVSSFDSPDMILSWTDPSPMPTDFDKYRVTLYNSANGGVTKTYHTKVPKLDYLFANNAADFAGARPSITATVYTMDIFGQSSTALPSTPTAIVNAAPSGTPTHTLAGGIMNYTVSWTAIDTSTFKDYAYTSVLTSATQNGTYASVWQGTDNPITIGTTTSNAVWVKIAHYDVFGQVGSYSVASSVTPTPVVLLDTTAPGAPTVPDTGNFLTIAINSTDPTGNSGWLTVKFKQPADISDISFYEIKYKQSTGSIWNSVIVAQSGSGSTALENVIPVQVGHTYDVEVRAVDFQTNTSTALTGTSGSLSVTTVATPSMPLSAARNAKSIQISHNLCVNGTSTRLPPYVSRLDVYVGPTGNTVRLLGSIPIVPTDNSKTAVLEWLDSGYATSTDNYLVVKAVSFSGVVSLASPQISITTGLSDVTTAVRAFIGTANIEDLTANKITAGTGIINALDVKNTLTIASGGALQSSNFSGGSAGYQLSETGLTIRDGTIKASALELQTERNLVPMKNVVYGYQASDTTIEDTLCDVWPSPGFVAFSTSSAALGTGSHPSGHYLSMGITANVAAQYVFFGNGGAADYTISVSPGKKYIVSAYVHTSVAGDTIKFFYKTSGTTYESPDNKTLTNGAWVRVSHVFTIAGTLGDADILIQLGVRIPNLVSARTVSLHGLQLEERTGSTDSPSIFKIPWGTTIDGAMITTGAIRSSDYAPGTDGWAIDFLGNCEFNGDLAKFRGEIASGSFSVTPTGEMTITADSPSLSITDTSGVLYSRISTIFSGGLETSIFGLRLENEETDDSDGTVVFQYPPGLFIRKSGNLVEFANGWREDGSNSIAVTTTASTSGASGASTITVASVTGITVGDRVTGTGISYYAYVTAIGTPTALTVTLSHPNIATVSGNISFFTQGTPLGISKLTLGAGMGTDSWHSQRGAVLQSQWPIEINTGNVVYLAGKNVMQSQFWTTEFPPESVYGFRGISINTDAWRLERLDITGLTATCAGGTSVTVSSASMLAVGQWIRWSDLSAYSRIESIVGTAITVYPAMTAETSHAIVVAESQTIDITSTGRAVLHSDRQVRVDSGIFGGALSRVEVNNSNIVLSSGLRSWTLSSTEYWTDVSFSNSWANYNNTSGTYFTVQYKKNPDNTISMRGMATHSSSPTTSSICTLPVGYRPYKRIRFLCGCMNDVALVDILPTGEVTVLNYGPSGNSAVLSLDGVYFSLDTYS